MTQEEKHLLNVALHVYMPYGVKIPVTIWNYDREEEEEIVELIYDINSDGYINTLNSEEEIYIEQVKPYLRPMDSMTNKEKEEYELLANRTLTSSVGFVHFEASELIRWLNKHLFDYNGLIYKGLALEAPDDMYKQKDNSMVKIGDKIVSHTYTDKVLVIDDLREFSVHCHTEDNYSGYFVAFDEIDAVII